MKIETAIKKVKEEYERAVNLEFVRDAVAYALYQVWKESDKSMEATMTDKELVKRLRIRADGMMDEWDSILCNCSELVTAASRIEQLHTELTKEKIDNTNLMGELATVAAERDRYKAERENDHD